MRITGYLHRVYPIKSKVVNGAKRVYRTIQILTNDGERLVVIYNADLIRRIEKVKPGTPIVVFPSGERDGVLFVNRLGRIIIANEEHTKDLKPYDELKKKITFYKFSTIRDVLEGEEGYYTVFADMYNVSRVYPGERQDGRFLVIRAAFEDYTGSLWASVFAPETILAAAGITEEDIFTQFEKLMDVDIKNEKEYKEKKKEAQTELAEMFSPALGRTFVVTIRKRKDEEKNDYDYSVIKVEFPNADSIKALAKGVVE